MYTIELPELRQPRIAGEPIDAVRFDGEGPQSSDPAWFIAAFRSGAVIFHEGEDGEDAYMMCDGQRAEIGDIIWQTPSGLIRVARWA